MAKAKSKTKKTSKAKKSKKAVQAVKPEVVEKRSPELFVASAPAISSPKSPQRTPAFAPYGRVLAVIVVLFLGLGGWLVLNKDDAKPAQSDASVGGTSLKVKADVPDQQGQLPFTAPQAQSSSGQTSDQSQSIQPAGGSSQQQPAAPQGYPSQTDVIMQRCGQYLDADAYAQCLQQAGY